MSKKISAHKQEQEDNEYLIESDISMFHITLKILPSLLTTIELRPHLYLEV
jgi:hypothetical protein